jgi:protocatechuate 3,4-dioxygenase beta subunit
MRLCLAAAATVAVGVAIAPIVRLTAQTPAPPPTGVITGVVVDATTRAPIADAVVALGGLPRGTTVQSRQLTDARGRFAFINLPANPRYTLSASRFGYLDGGFLVEGVPGRVASTVVVKDGEWVSGVTIAIGRAAAVGGRVVDERGEPVAGVFVRALAKLRVQGRDELATGPVTHTDDRGAYRLAGLAPGRYVIQVPSVQAAVSAGTTPATARGQGPGTGAANPQALPEGALEETAGARLTVGRYPIPPPPAGGRWFAYPITFHPSTTAVDQATVVALSYGEERTGVDVQIAPVAAATVSGVVEGPPEALTALTLRLLAAGLEGLGQGSESATVFVGSDGRFTFLNVPAGTYTLDAPRTMSEYSIAPSTLGSPTLPAPPGRDGSSMHSGDAMSAPDGTSFVTRNFRGASGNYWGRTSIVVAGQDLRDVVVRMRPAASVSGEIVVETDPAKPPVAPPSFWGIGLEPADGSPRLGEPTRDSLSRDSDPNEFELNGLSAGEYVLRLGNTGWAIKSAMLAGRDYADAPIDGSSGAALRGLVVTVTNRVASVTGTARDLNGTPAASATVIVFPADPALRTKVGLVPRRIKTARTTNDGGYRFGTLPAGEYLVVAIPGSRPDAWQAPDFFTNAERVAVRVSLGWGDTKSVDLPLATIR